MGSGAASARCRLVSVVALDSSVILAWLLEDEGLRRQALAVRADVEAGRLRPVGAAPLPFELRNGLVKGARHGRIGWADVAPEIATLAALRVPIIPPADDGRLLGLCRDHGLGWADAHWIDLAIRLDVALVTADHRLARQMRGGPAWVEWLGDRPTE